MRWHRSKFNQFFDSLETDMNQSSSHPNHENRTIYEEPPPQGLSVARDGSFLNFCNRSATQEAPSGAVAFIVPEGDRGNNPRIIAEYYDLS